MNFDPESELHASFIASYACLYANMHRIDIPEEYADPRAPSSKLRMAQKAATFEVKKFVPNDQKAKQIEE